jgi:hypothetical protein
MDDLSLNVQMQVLTDLCKNVVWDDETEARLLLKDLFEQHYNEWCPSTCTTECIAVVAEAAGMLKRAKSGEQAEDCHALRPTLE